jgi:hypothetical protein
MVADAPPSAPTKSAASSADNQLPALRNQLAPLVKDDLTMQAQVDAMPINTSTTITTSGLSTGRRGGPQTRTTTRDQLLSSLDSGRSQVASICTQINDILAKNSKSEASTLIQSRWSQIMLLIKHDDEQQLNLATAGPNVRDPMLKQIRDNGKQIDSLLSKINADTGAYSP